MNVVGSSSEERAGATVSYVLAGIFGVLGGLIGWLIWKDKGSFSKDQTTEALNFSITTLIGFVILRIVIYVLLFLTTLIGFRNLRIATYELPFLGILPMLLWLAQLIFSIMGAMAANKGTSYRYPYTLRLIK